MCCIAWEIGRIGVIEAVHQWNGSMLHHGRHLAHERNYVFKCKQHSFHDPKVLENINTQ